jgi:hypothetical protein
MEIHFDIDKIVKIKFVEKEEEKNIQWVESQQIKKFFGLYNTGNFTRACFKNLSSCLDSEYTEETLREYGYIIEGKKIYRQAWVGVYFENSDSVSRSFPSEEEAQEWISKLSRQSKKNFEIVNY